jgi:hypothetical protein
MARIDAHCIVAFMIDLKPFRDIAAPFGPRYSVRAFGARLAIKPQINARIGVLPAAFD